MTFLQVLGLMAVIHKAGLVSFYDRMVSYGIIHGAKLPSLEEFLQLSCKEEAAPVFDEKTDKVLEDRAKRLLEERLKNRGRQ